MKILFPNKTLTTRRKKNNNPNKLDGFLGIPDLLFLI